MLPISHPYAALTIKTQPAQVPPPINLFSSVNASAK